MTGQTHFVVMFSYELNASSVLQAKFQLLLENKLWVFKYKDKKLPPNICLATFEKGISADRAKELANRDIENVVTEMKKKDPKFVIQRDFMILFPLSDSIMDIKVIG